MEHGPQAGLFPLEFAVPSRCAELLRSGQVDVGLVPVIELERQPLQIVPPLGIASQGPVLSILLLSKVPPASINSLAVDSSSRTSVVLTQILLAERFGCRPVIHAAAPDLPAMLASNDAALLIGDPALLADTSRIPFNLDLGAEWTDWSGLPMVFAVWAARPGIVTRAVESMLQASYLHGRASLDEIVNLEAVPRSISPKLARAYLTRHIHFELTPPYLEGLALYRQLARRLGFV